jgi:hypothetical protein
MHPDLEAVIAADEEGRARIATAEARRDAALRDVRRDSDAALAARRSAAEAAVAAEIAAITREGEQRESEARRRNDEYLRLLAEAGERARAKAIEVYTRIVMRP